MTLYHTPSGKYWHMDKYCRRVLSWQWDRLKAQEFEQPEVIALNHRCQGCWK